MIGYARIILAALALHYMPYHPRYSMLLYGASSLLDAADGYAARVLNQSSEFGAVLDMVTDRYAPTPPPGTNAHGFREQMRNIMSTVLPCFYIPRLCPPLPVPHQPRLFQPLHAHVQVRRLSPPSTPKR
jgi:hypothetical protein